MLQEIDEGLWVAESKVRMGGGVVFPARMMVVEVEEGRLLVYSPIEATDELVEEVRGLGELQWVVAPNDQHNMFVEGWAERCPEAEVYGTAAVRESQPSVEFAGLLEEGAPEAWSGRVELAGIDGTRSWNEFVCYLPAHRTLLCADLVFNIQEIPNLATSILLWLVGARKRFTQSRLERWFLVTDREAYGRSLGRIFEWSFDRVIMAHGEIVEEEGYERLVEACGWALDAPEIEDLSRRVS
jgi:uncharacterized protein YndB with AHSA1/START domain